jgi:hypothetical protein
MQSTDTIYTRGLKITEFKKRINETDYHFHEITVISNSKYIFKNVSTGIKNLVENTYFKTKRDIETDVLKNELNILQKNLVQIDSLRSLYKEVALREAQKETGSSTIEFSQKQFDSNKNDLSLFQTSNQILIQIENLNNQRIVNDNIMNFVSNFEEVGVLDRKIIHKKYFQIAILFGGLMLIFILLMQLNSYLIHYKKVS